MTNHFPTQMPLSVERERYLTTATPVVFFLRRGPERYVCFRHEPIFHHIQAQVE